MKKIIVLLFLVFSSSAFAENNTEYWTCPMHHDVKMEHEGRCPICGMNLTPVEKQIETKKDGVATVHIKPKKVEHFNPEIIMAKNIKMQRNIRLLGRVVPAKEQEYNIPAQIEGRIEKVYVNSEGDFVKKGDPVVEIYSPELIVAAREYLSAIKSKDKNYVNTSINKLLLWGVKKEQLNKWAKTQKIPESITVYSNASGIVKNKNAVVGKYFKTGESFYDLVDLSKIWVELDVYEHDIAHLKIGQKVKLKFSAYPRDKWTTEIDFISPVLNEATRTLTTRVTIDNPDNKLKLGMVAEANLHLELGDNILSIPSTAIIDTGKRKVVWIEAGENKFVAKSVETGVESEGYTEIINGVNIGDKVVVEGNFMLDAEAQLYGGYEDKKTDMKQPMGHHNH